MTDSEKLAVATKALCTIAYPGRGTPEETMDVEQLGLLAAKALIQIGYERD